MDVDARNEGTDHPNTPVPHDILWFPDGNVVLATDAYIFKVFKGILSMHSSVFRDMFELQTVNDSTAGRGGDGGIAPELYEGLILPLVTLVGDKGEDIAHLLRSIFDRECVFLPSFSELQSLTRHVPKDTITVTTTIRLSTSS